MSNIKKLTSKKYKILYILIYIIYTLLYLLSPLFVMKFIDSIIAKDFNRLLIYAILYFACFVFIQVFSYLFSIMVGKVKANNFINFFSKLNLILKGFNFAHNKLSRDDLNQQIGQNFEMANPYFFIQPVELIFSILTTISIFVIMFLISWKIALILLFFVPCSFVVSKLFEKKMYKYADENLKNVSNVKSYINDQYVLSKEERFLDKKQLGGFHLLLKKFQIIHNKNNRIKSVYLYFFTYCFLNFAILLVIILSGFLVYKEFLTIGVLYAFQNYTSQLWIPGESLMSYSSEYQQIKPALNQLNELLNMDTNEYAKDKIIEISLSDFCLLDQNYNELNEPFNYTFYPGNVYLITGENGSGKTTLLESILGFTDRYKGNLLINGTKKAFDDFVYISANSYISQFYDIGLSQSSSGQKRLGQIELFLKTDKSVYIFDEPTNFIDEEHKMDFIAIFDALEKQGKLVIVVSHDKDICRNQYQNLRLSRINKEL